MATEMLTGRAAYRGVEEIETPDGYRDAAKSWDPLDRQRPPGFGRWPWWTPIGALAAGLVLLYGPVAALDDAAPPFAASLGEGMFGFVLIACAAVLARRFGGLPRSAADLGFRAAPSRASVGWVLLARVALVIFSAIYVSNIGHVTPNVPVVPFGGVSTVDAVDVVLAVVVLAPLLEEIFFRGFMYAALRGSMPTVPAALITGALFGAIHPIYGYTAWNLVPVLMCAGFIMCLLYEKTGSLWPPIAFHVFMNIGVIALFTGTTALPLALIGGTALLFLLAPWRLFSAHPVPRAA
jgi:membrane protease YdiL (CAAX protease family)